MAFHISHQVGIAPPAAFVGNAAEIGFITFVVAHGGLVVAVVHIAPEHHTVI